LSLWHHIRPFSYDITGKLVIDFNGKYESHPLSKVQPVAGVACNPPWFRPSVKVYHSATATGVLDSILNQAVPGLGIKYMSDSFTNVYWTLAYVLVHVILS